MSVALLCLFSGGAEPQSPFLLTPAEERGERERERERERGKPLYAASYQIEKPLTASVTHLIGLQ